MINIDVNLAGIWGTGGTATQTSQPSSLSAQSFATILSDAVSETLSALGINPDSITFNVVDQPSQTPAASQTPATSGTPPVVTQTPTANPVAASPTPVSSAPVSSAPVSSAPVSSAPVTPTPVAPTPAASQSPFAATTPPTTAPPVVNPPPTAPTTGTSSQTWYATTPADNAYWAAQPPAVQQLRGIDNLAERQQLGEQLANEGYSIDVPIMVWGWDAGKVTAARESYGYTWVPSALQAQVTAAPGVTGAGITPYDATNPPSGSIQV
jgi:hypothetical protein